MCSDADAHYLTTSAMLIDTLTAKLYRTLPPLTNTIGQSCDPTSRISSANGNHYPDVGANTIEDSDIFVTVMVIGLTSLAHEFQNTFSILATAWETAWAEDHEANFVA